LSAQTRDEVFGPYEEAYRQKVEQVGSVNYPPPVAGRRLYGVVRLTATIHQDGSLALVEIMQSSGSPDLDDAARRIVQMAAPFQPFTPAMRARADLVSITRSFNFIRAGEAVQSQ
ncbi:MAG: TonB family protein, partial [Betaproteobacteria bacterium]|nr:TonB family protein [Betaproteobacteria bacterium]